MSFNKQAVFAASTIGGGHKAGAGGGGALGGHLDVKQWGSIERLPKHRQMLLLYFMTENRLK